MRISESVTRTIKDSVARHFGAEARVYLFGSRVDDAARGGDIDLLVETGLAGQEALRAKVRVMTDIQLAHGDQKIDIVVTSPGSDDQRAIVSEARKEAVPL
ncbi:MAG: nucleotidyltransferase family protein [Spirochaetaceae bacterium]